MRFVSHSPSFAVQIVEEKVHYSNFGERITDRENYIAQFNQNDVTNDDLAFAERVFANDMQGRQTLIDEVTLAPILMRVSVFDTDEEALRHGWEGLEITVRDKTLPFKEFVEQKLSERAVNHSDFRQVEELPATIPWPSYLMFRGTLEDLVTKIISDGYDLRDVLAYERQQPKRQVVIEALEQAIEQQNQALAEAEQVPA